MFAIRTATSHSAEPKYTIDGVENVRAEMVGDSEKDIWFTEFGWFTDDNPPLESEDNDGGRDNWEIPVTEAQQADFAIRAIRFMSKFDYVAKAFWYNSHDQKAQNSFNRKSFGLLNRNLTVKDSYQELKSFLGRRARSGQRGSL